MTNTRAHEKETRFTEDDLNEMCLLLDPDYLRRRKWWWGFHTRWNRFRSWWNKTPWLEMVNVYVVLSVNNRQHGLRVIISTIGHVMPFSWPAHSYTIRKHYRAIRSRGKIIWRKKSIGQPFETFLEDGVYEVNSFVIL